VTTGPTLPQHMVPVFLWALGSLMADRHGNVPSEVKYAHQWLTTMATSVCGSEQGCEREQLTTDDLIGAEEAASLLGCSARHVRAIASDLDGAQPSGRDYVFWRQSVIDYANARREHRGLAQRSHPS
jgi:hypothetical protein